MKKKIGLLASLLAASACYDTSLFPPEPDPPPCGFTDPQWTLELGASKRLELRWTPSAEVGYAEWIESTDQGVRVTPLLDWSAGLHSQVAPLHLLADADHALRLCDDESCQCVDTYTAESSAEDLRAAIGVIQPDDLAADNVFGTAVALSHDGSHLAVGAAFMNADGDGVGVGSVRMFVWQPQAYRYEAQALPFAAELEAQVGATDRLGYAVAMDADAEVLAVGAPAGGAGPGAVHVFERASPQQPWPTQGQRLSGLDDGDRFGIDVALSADGDVLVVGASREGSHGAVHVFTREPGTPDSWTEQQLLTSDAPHSGDQFGVALALDHGATRLVIGAPGEDSLGENTGAVHLFERDGLGVWRRTLTLQTPETLVADGFGEAVALDGAGTLLAAAAPARGAVYLCCRDEATWTCPAIAITEPTAEASDVADFGGGLAISGDGTVLAVAARKDDSDRPGLQLDDPLADPPGTATDSGAVHVYPRRSSAGPLCGFADLDGALHRHGVKAPAPLEFDQFGRSLTLSEAGQTLVVGAYKRDRDPAAKDNHGAVYVY